jgi:hypothetical protein
MLYLSILVRWRHAIAKYINIPVEAINNVNNAMKKLSAYRLNIQYMIIAAKVIEIVVNAEISLFSNCQSLCILPLLSSVVP